MLLAPVLASYLFRKVTRESHNPLLAFLSGLYHEQLVVANPRPHG